MKKKLVVSGLTATIYDAVLSKTPGIMTNNRTDRTDECIRAVAEHMKFKADNNDQDKGFWQYHWDGIGTLTWKQESEQKQTNADRIRSMSDEELAEFLIKSDCCIANAGKVDCSRAEECGVCEDVIRNWLHSEVEE